MSFLNRVVQYLFKKVLLYDLILAVVAVLSFLFTRSFSFIALSERLLWFSIGVFFVGGTVAFANLFGGGGSRSLMFPYNIRKPDQAKKFMEEAPALRQISEQRMDVGIQIWLIGLGCLGLSALVEVLLG